MLVTIFTEHTKKTEMELPTFKYSPNAYKLDIFKEEIGICSICNEKRNLKYDCSFYSIEKPNYICPWCIANGQTAEKYKGEFNDYCGIEGVSPDPNDPEPTIPKELLFEITNKTPSYYSWQQEVWLTHCNEPCAFIGYAEEKNIEPLMTELNEDIQTFDFEPDFLKEAISKGGVSGYLFQCVNCGQHRLHIDFD